MDRCIRCQGKLPPLNGVEENDFRHMCEECEADVADTAYRSQEDDYDPNSGCPNFDE